jgi:hypothetical protein
MRAGGSALSDLAALFALGFRLARERITIFAAAVGLMTAFGAAADLAPDEFGAPALILFGLSSLYLQALVTASALELEPFRTSGRRFLSLIGMSIVTSVAVALGLLLAVIPGLLLLVRWSVSVPVLLDEELGPYESLQRSWELTGDRWTLAIAVTAVLIPASGPQWLVYWLTAYPAVPVPLVLAMNLYSSLLLVFQWLLGAALYRLIMSRTSATILPEIFS